MRFVSHRRLKVQSYSSSLCKWQTRILQQCSTRSRCSSSSKALGDQKWCCSDCFSEKEIWSDHVYNPELTALATYRTENSLQAVHAFYRGLHRMAPSCIADMCVKRSFESEHYNLRSAVRGELVVPLAGKSTLGRRGFKYSSPSLWNALPHDIRDYCLTLIQFTSGLKTIVSWGVLSITASAFVMLSPREGAI